LCASWMVWGASSVLMLISTNITGVCLAFGLNAFGFNLASGTREALTFDSLKQVGQEERYISVSSWQNVLWRSSATISRLMAGVAILLGYRTCYLIHIGTSLVGACLSLTLTEAENGQPHSDKKLSLQQVAADFTGQTGAVLTFLRDTPMVRAYMVSTALVSGTITLVGFFLQQHLSDIGAAGAVTLGPLLFCVSFGGIVGARLAVRLYALSFVKTFLLSGGCITVGMLLCGLPTVLLCVVGGFVMTMFDEVLCTVTEAKLNHMFPSEQRASLVSVFSMCFSLSMIVLSPLLGALCSLLGIGRAFMIMAAFVACTLLFSAKRLT
ncbi:MAG: hypothetical protein RR461_09885, partial [Angelakisella sp.]